MMTISKLELNKYNKSDKSMPIELFVNKLRGAVILEDVTKPKSKRQELIGKLEDKGIEFKKNIKTEELEKLLEGE